MLTHIWWSLPLTIGVYFLARAIYIKFKLPVLNPLLISIVIIIPLLIFTGTSYNHYFEGSHILNDLLQPAVVALAFPLYEQLHQIRAQWKSIITICFAGSVIAMVTGTAIAFMMGATPEIAASILPKSVTTPIAIAVSDSIGGVAAISAVCDFRRDTRRYLRPYPVQTTESHHESLTRPGNGYGFSRPRYCPLCGRRLCGRCLQLTGINDLRDYYFSDGTVYLPGAAGIIRLT